MMANIDVSKMNLERVGFVRSPEGNICEGTGSNVFFKDQELYTKTKKR